MKPDHIVAIASTGMLANDDPHFTFWGFGGLLLVLWWSWVDRPTSGPAS